MATKQTLLQSKLITGGCSGHVGRLDELRRLLYSSHQYSVVPDFPAMTPPGKDGVIRPRNVGQSIRMVARSSASSTPAPRIGADFLWRTTRNLPNAAKSVYSTLYYEEVLIVRVPSRDFAR